MKQKQLYFYILSDSDRANGHKVGITINPDQRLRTYRTQSPGCVFHSLYPIPNKSIETKLLYELSGAFRTVREVVYGPLPIIQNIVEGYLIEHDLLETQE